MHIKVKVKTGARKESFKVVSQGLFEISVREKPLQNAANERVIALVAKHFKVPVKRVRMLSGHHRPSKMLVIEE